MKALTLWQPWASLVAMGVKTIETRSWSTKYRGRLYIHAGLHLVEPPLGSWWWVNGEDGYVLWSKGGRDHPRDEPMPLGAIVASCELVDVVPIVKASNEVRKPGKFIHVYPGLRPGSSVLWLCELRVHGGIETLDLVEDQRPYGDFTPGRYAWLLDDIQPVDPPVPCRGRQGLWTPPEGLLSA